MEPSHLTSDEEIVKNLPNSHPYLRYRRNYTPPKYNNIKKMLKKREDSADELQVTEYLENLRRASYGLININKSSTSKRRKK